MSLSNQNWLMTDATIGFILIDGFLNTTLNLGEIKTIIANEYQEQDYYHGGFVYLVQEVSGITVFLRLKESKKYALIIVIDAEHYSENYMDANDILTKAANISNKVSEHLEKILNASLQDISISTQFSRPSGA